MLKLVRSWFSAIVVGSLTFGVHAAEVPSEAVEAWKSLDEKVDCGQLVCVFSQWKEGVQTTQDADYRFERDGEKVAVYMGAWARSESQNATRLQLQNTNGYFGLSKGAKDEQWLVSLAEPPESPRGKQVLGLGKAEVMLSMPIRIFGTNLARMWESDNAIFKNWETFEHSDGRTLARFEVNASEDREFAIPAGKFKIVVDPSNGYRMVSSEYIASNGYRYLSQLDYPSGEPSSPFPLKEERVTLDDTGKEINRTVFTVQRATYDPPSDEIFLLSHYGVDEIAFDSTSTSYTWVYAGMLLLGICCFTGYLVLRSRS